MTEPGNIRKGVNQGLAWIGLAQSFVSFLDFLANVIILALWISPAEYGIAALAITLFPVLDLAVDMGLSAAVIQRDDHTEDKISTVFWLNVAMSLVLWALLAFAIGPGLGAAHGHPIIGLLLTAYGAKLVWQNVYQIPKSLMRRELRFKEIAATRAVANVLEFGAKVGSAAAGAGIWCFLIGPMAREIGWGVGIQICHPWRPRFVFKLREARDWAVFGIKASMSQMLFHLYTNVDYQVVGFYFGPTANGYYRLAYDIVLEPCRILAHIVNQVAFPAYARLKHHRKQLVDQFVSLTRLNLVILLGFLIIVLVSLEDIIGTFWGPEWLPAAEVGRILVIVGALRALSFLVPPLLEGIGYPGRSLAYNAVASIVLPAMFVLGAELFGDRLGYVSVAWAWAVGYPIAFAVLAYMAFGLLELRAVDYLRRVMGIPVCALAAGAAAYGARLAVDPLAPGARLAVVAVVTAGVFLGCLAAFQGLSPNTVARALRGDE